VKIDEETNKYWSLRQEKGQSITDYSKSLREATLLINSGHEL